MKNILVLIILGLFLGCGRSGEEQTAAEASGELHRDTTKTVIPVKVLELEPREFTEQGKFFGQVEGITQAEMVTYTGGRVNKVMYKDGAYVKKGTRLCDIEGSKYQLSYEAALLNKKILEEEFERSQAHFKSGSYSQLQLDQVESRLMTARQATLDAKKNRDAAWCVSPVNGWVTGHYIEPHQNLSPGSPTLVVSNYNKIKVKVGIPENEINGYSKKGRASIRLPSLPDSLFPANISSIAHRVDPRDRNFSVEITLKNPGKIIKPGQTVEVLIQKEVLKDVLVVPNEVLLNLEKGLGIMLVKNGVAKRVMVQRGGMGSTHSHILSGLASGDHIIVSGQALVVDGTPVSIQND